jgi:eukaryotic-like serine/threonine-protein kinase
MPAAIGSRLGPYEIQSVIGKGGMGEVYQARDTRLDRTVAIKMLPDHLSADPQLRERFGREARAISSLSHPNICVLYDIGSDRGVDFLVMEYLEGETLAARITKGPLTLADAIPIAIQIADALAKAHRAGITHRDLKPGNVMLTKSGAKLLDFGLAQITPASGGQNLSAMQTPTPNLTMEGTLLGTLPYMAPEQVESGSADARSDVWAFGCVLYEMVTGRPAFAGKGQASLIAAVMGTEPAPVTSLQASIPPAFDRLVRHCLAKDPNRRWQNAFDVALELEGIADRSTEQSAALNKRSRSWPAIATFVIAATVLSAVWLGRRTSVTVAKTEIRFEVAPPPGTEFIETVESVPLAVSPDGLTLAFVAVDDSGVSRIWTRSVSDLESHPLSGTEGANSIVWSRDGKSIAFFGAGKLRRLDLPNGAPIPVCDIPTGIGFAGSWGPEGEIIFASVQGDAIYRVPAAGGTAEKILQPDTSRKEVRLSWPGILPDGHGFFYLSRTSDAVTNLMWVPPGKPPQVVGPLSSRFELITPDLLIFVRDGALLGQRFDFASGRLTGTPVPVASSVAYFFSSGWAGFAVSSGGSLFYWTPGTSNRLLWVSRDGKPVTEQGKPGKHLNVALSPDGRSLVADRTQSTLGTYDLWLMDLERGVETRLTSSPDVDFGPTWLPDGKAIVYSSIRGSVPNLTRRSLVTGEEEFLLPRQRFQESTDVSHDGRVLAFIERDSDGGFHAWTLRLEGDRQPTALFKPDFRQVDVRFSQDGGHVAYLSDESGEWEAYVGSLANPSEKVRLSRHGATHLRWRRDGREILFLSRDREMISVSVRTAPKLELGTPVTLFTLPDEKRWLSFDVTADGQRFIAVERLVPSGAQPATAIMNWASKKLSP